MGDVSNYLASIETRIGSINDCAALRAAADDLTAELSGMLADVQAQINALAPLLVVPSPNPGAIVTWITALIATYTAPYTASLAELALLTARITAILATLENKISTLGCSFTPPTVP